MYRIDFHKPIHIHFIGIGGISMSGLAEILLEEGFTVSAQIQRVCADEKAGIRRSTDRIRTEGGEYHTGYRLRGLHRSHQPCQP